MFVGSPGASTTAGGGVTTPTLGSDDGTEVEGVLDCGAELLIRAIRPSVVSPNFVKFP